jgi:hypothetical protein
MNSSPIGAYYRIIPGGKSIDVRYIFRDRKRLAITGVRARENDARAAQASVQPKFKEGLAERAGFEPALGC